VVGQHLDFSRGRFQKRRLFIPGESRLIFASACFYGAASSKACGVVPAVVVAFSVIQANVSSEVAGDDLFISFRLRSGCCWKWFADRIGLSWSR